jgi:hypothetical protein
VTVLHFAELSEVRRLQLFIEDSNFAIIFLTLLELFDLDVRDIVLYQKGF